MVVMMIAAVLLVSITMLIHYESLRLASDALPSLTLPPRIKIVALVFVAFLAHMLEVGVYALAYWGVSEWTAYGYLAYDDGSRGQGFEDYIYFSAATFTTLGFGDLVLKGSLPLLGGIEALNGLVLIGWSASVTYLALQKFWPLHGSERSAAERQARPRLYD